MDAARRERRHHRKAAAAAAAAASAAAGGGGVGGGGPAAFGDVFGGPPRFAAPFGAAPLDYAEVFGGVAAACSIPYLDLPPAPAAVGFFAARGKEGDYGEIFARFDLADFAAPYEDLFGGPGRETEPEPEGRPRRHPAEAPDHLSEKNPASWRMSLLYFLNIIKIWIIINNSKIISFLPHPSLHKQNVSSLSCHITRLPRGDLMM
ncbi:hypothetical protein U9M48_044969 [Paspalum notatum var. saurae]|uniref:Uncharacterized protein n=1 Tax=Paspalum notatum var. saurae TaxID=547442 RepID=A0AAQ3UWB8_PASNO